MEKCKCGNQACAVREARGLAPFCRMSAPAKDTRTFYPSYTAAAAARKDGQRIVSATTSGGPKRFVLEVTA